MKNIKNLLLLVPVLLLIFAGCEKFREESYEVSPKQDLSKNFESVEGSQDVKSKSPSEPSSYTRQKDAGSQQTPGTDLKILDRLVVKTGKMTIESDKYDETEKKITEITNSLGGLIVTSTSSANATGKKQGVITIKVPSKDFDKLVAEVSSTGKVSSQNINSSDVTEEYIDLEARQKTQKELEERLYKLLQEKTTRLSDILEVEQKLSDVRQKIESTEGRMKFLRSQADYSTLTVSIFEPSLLETSSGGGFFYELGQAIKSGMKGFTKVLASVITILIAILPLLLLVYIVYRIIKRVIRKKKTAKQ